MKKEITNETNIERTDKEKIKILIDNGKLSIEIEPIKQK